MCDVPPMWLPRLPTASHCRRAWNGVARFRRAGDRQRRHNAGRSSARRKGYHVVARVNGRDGLVAAELPLLAPLQQSSAAGRAAWDRPPSPWRTCVVTAAKASRWLTCVTGRPEGCSSASVAPAATLRSGRCVCFTARSCRCSSSATRITRVLPARTVARLVSFWRLRGCLADHVQRARRFFNVNTALLVA